MQQLELELRGEYITLDALLKATGLASSGGGAKALIAAGKVEVDGRPELRKTCKLRAGQVVAVHGARVRVVALTERPDEGGVEVDADAGAGAGEPIDPPAAPAVAPEPVRAAAAAPDGARAAPRRAPHPRARTKSR